jgi:hypothetical protein
MRTAADVHARAQNSINAAISTARRADGTAIQRFLDGFASTGVLGDHELAFLRQAHELTLATATALSAVLKIHASQSDSYGTLGCRVCGTLEFEICQTVGRVADVLAPYRMKRLPVIDAAEAYRRTRDLLTATPGAGHLLISVEEFSEGFAIRSAHSPLPAPPAVPTPETELVLVVDRRDGGISSWPLMPLTTLAVQYRKYREGRPILL